MSDGPTYLVHQPDGTTFGPADVALLKEWVAAGIVTRTTALSIQGDERRTPAAVVPGLFEPEQQGQATAQPAEPMYQPHLASGTTDALALADLLRMVEAGEIVSTTPISLVGGQKKVPAAVVPGLEFASRRGVEVAGGTTVEPPDGSKQESDSLDEYALVEAGMPTTVQEADGVALVTPLLASEIPPTTSAKGISLFLFWSIASTLVSLAVCMSVLGWLTKVEFPTFASFGDKGWKGDAIKDGLKEGVSHGWRGVAGALVVGLVIVVATLVQRWGANFWSCFLVPAVWLGGLGTAAVWGEASRDREQCVWTGVFCGVWLGYWYAAILSAIWFGPHPLAR